MLFRLNTPTMGIVTVDGCGLAVTIPAGSVLTVDEPLSNALNSPPVEVSWSGKAVRMFPIDILERCEEVR